MAGFGGSVKLTGESDYKKALSSITDNLKVLSSEMKVVTSQYDRNDKSVENLGSQNEILNKKISEQQQKVNLLTKALSDAKEETGENSTTTKKWQNELNNAQSELNALKKKVNDNETAMEQAEDATDDNAKSLKKFGDEAKESGTHALKLGDIIKANLISDAIKGGLSALANSMKQIGSALIGLGKDAITSFADYEQLIGGVETLFKDSAGIVEEYANNAYKTAGLSANEYMETVTSFSASLLASLDGDTEKSAKIADMAITDMSDNANKMGTDMSMLQTTYAGFAKQNYTMLDNLKLGYGGTKEEMQRLLKEAEAMPEAMGQKFDISNYADVVKAINVVQQNMGITGTTAKEASSTIAGSIASMKSSWTNFIAGLANANAPVGALLDKLMESVQIVAQNLMPVIGTVIDSIIGVIGENFGSIVEMGLDLIMQLAGSITTNSTYLVDTIGHVVSSIINAFATLIPQILPVAMSLITEFVNAISQEMPTLLNTGVEILNSLINGIVEVIPTLIPIVMDILMTLVNTILDNLPQILEMGIVVLTELIKGIADTLPDLIPTIVDAVILIVETLIDNIDMLIDAGIQLILALADGLIEALPRLIEKIPVIIQKLFDAFVRNFPKIVQAGGQLIGKLIVGIIGSLGELLMQAPKIITTLIQGIASVNQKIKEAGGNLVKGIWEGITGSLQWLKDKVKGWVGNVLDFIKRLFGIHSPSKVFEEEIGNNLALGIGEGFAGTMDNVNKQMADAIQTDYDLSVNSNLKGANATGTSSYYLDMVNAFKQALREVKVVMDDREMGTFVTDTMERVVYA